MILFAVRSALASLWSGWSALQTLQGVRGVVRPGLVVAWVVGAADCLQFGGADWVSGP